MAARMCVASKKTKQKITTQVSILGPLCSLPYSFLYNLFHLVGFLESKMIFSSFIMVNLSIYFPFIIHFYILLSQFITHERALF